MEDEATVAHVDRRDLDIPAELSRRRLRSRLLVGVAIVAIVVAAITLLPGLGGLRARLSHAQPGWIVLGAALKLLSGLGYVAVFRAIFCRRMSWRVSTQIGMSELGANALFPTGGAGGLALGAWALRRGGMAARAIGRRTVAFFLLTSVPNVLGVIVLGAALAAGAIAGERNLLLTALPAAVAAGAVLATLVIGRAAGRRARALQRRAGADAGAPAQDAPEDRPPRSSRRARVVREGLLALGDGVEESLALLRRADLMLVCGLLAYLVFDVAILWAGFRALGAAPPVANLAMAYLIGELGGLIPVPGGIGGVEAGLLGMLVAYHVSITAAAGAVIIYRAIVLWVPAVAGSAAFVALRRTLRREADALAGCAPQTETDVIGVGRAVIHGER